MKVKINSHSCPSYATNGSAGMDLVTKNFKKWYSEAHPDGVEFGEMYAEVFPLAPGERILIGTGLKMNIPEGYELQIRPRSGMALKSGITVINSPGTIDSDYRDEIGIILINHGFNVVAISIGDRVAQGVFAKYETVEFEYEESLGNTERIGGFGSTGK